VEISCPEQEKEVTFVGGAVLDANGEPVMSGIVVAYDARSVPGDQHPWAKDLVTTANPKKWDVAKMGKKEWRDDWGGKWMNFAFEIYWFNVMMGSQDTYRHIEGAHPSLRTILEWSVWVESPSGERLSEIVTCKTYSHAKNPKGATEPDPEGGPPQCFIFFKLR